MKSSVSNHRIERKYTNVIRFIRRKMEMLIIERFTNGNFASVVQLGVMKKLYLTTFVVAVMSLFTACSSNTWHDDFRNAKCETEPWTFWYWMYGNVSDDGIRADLKAMKEAGIEGFYLMPIKSPADNAQLGGTALQLSPDWWNRMRTVVTIADSLHLQMGIHYSDGFALGGGPWITPDESMQKVVWFDTIVSGGSINIELPLPKHKADYYEDITTYAYPASFADDNVPNTETEFPLKSKEPCDIVYKYSKSFTIRRVEIVTGGNNYQAHRWTVSASDDGKNYTEIAQIEPARQGWQNTDAYATYAIPTTTAKYFKFHWTPEGSDPGSEDMDAAKWSPTLKVAAINIGSEPVVDGYEGKSGAVWRVSKAYIDKDNEAIDAKSLRIIDINNNRIETVLPEGRWHIIRMGHTTTGHTNATGGGGRGLECDKFSAAAINKQYAHWFGNIDSMAQTISKSVLTRLHVDSWECGSQNWSANFADEFKRRRGYDLLQWLPVYAGVRIESEAKSDAVLRDIRQTIAELINDIFFAEVRRLADANHKELSTECVSPTMVSDGMLHFAKADYPMGEFWVNSPTHDKPNDMLDAISAAHIYGKRTILSESFTEVRGTWDETPAMLKPLLDRNFALGINGIVFHVYTHNPWLDRKPGMTLDGIGTFFQRDNTWWREMPAFTEYINRCQSLLQRGMPVVDIAVYTGDETPRRAILPERLTTSLPGLFGDSIIASEKARLQNEDVPMETSPVGVKHTKNMTKADQFTNPLHGYKYDSMNHDALASAHVENGAIVTAGGMRYEVLVVPQERKMNPDRIVDWTLIENLKAQGARIITEPWLEPSFASMDILPDVQLPEGVDFAHRRTASEDIYFIANLTDSTISAKPTFRVADTYKYVYIANPLNGRIFEYNNELNLEASESAFVIFTNELIATDKPQNAKSSITINTPWKVKFESTNLSIEMDTLRDWTTYEEPEMKYYSGHATYENSFDAGRSVSGAYIRIEELHDIATIYVNDKYCGTLWTKPYTVDVSSAVRSGKNTLRIEVVNTWANALLGSDLETPPYSGIWTNAKYRRAEKNTLPAGIVGKVEVVLE